MPNILQIAIDNLKILIQKIKYKNHISRGDTNSGHYDAGGGSDGAGGSTSSSSLSEPSSPLSMICTTNRELTSNLDSCLVLLLP